MNIGIGRKNIVVSVEKVRAEPANPSALIGATDREVEQFVRKSNTAQDPRWDIAPTIMGYRI